MKIVAIAVLAAVSLAACASTPESIAPAYVSEMTYQNWTCDQLSEEMGRLNGAYANVADQQHKARNNDTVGVILLGLPVSSLSGQNVSAQVATVKGNQVAVERSATLKNCSQQVRADTARHK
jgi:starvation-inducible outer membrane lipoprotein